MGAPACGSKRLARPKRANHQACDTIVNVNETILDQMADAAAFATATFGFAKVPVTQVTSKPGKGKSRAGNFARKGPHLIK